MIKLTVAVISAAIGLCAASSAMAQGGFKQSSCTSIYGCGANGKPLSITTPAPKVVAKPTPVVKPVPASVLKSSRT